MTFSKTYAKLHFAIVKLGGAECEDQPELFFPEDYPLPVSAGMTKVAIEICKRCPVQQLCLDYAITDKVEYGIWGGSLPSDR